MIQLYQDIMNVKSVNSTNFQAKFQFANTKPKPPTLLEQGCHYALNPCYKTINGGVKFCKAIVALPTILKKIKNIKNSIKQPS